MGSVVVSLGSRAQISSCGPQASLLPDRWDLPRSGIEPVSPAVASRATTAEPPGKPLAFSALVQAFLYLPVAVQSFLHVAPIHLC